MTEFLHDVVRKNNLDRHMESNPNNDWDAYFHPDQDPWSDVDITQLGRDWLAQAERRERDDDTRQNIHYSGGPF
jgi:hypothetical protein